jgi:hypothetical protein
MSQQPADDVADPLAHLGPMLGHAMPTAWGEDSKEWIARTVVLSIVAIVAVPLALVFGLGSIGLLLAFFQDLGRLAFGFLRR